MFTNLDTIGLDVVLLGDNVLDPESGAHRMCHSGTEACPWSFDSPAGFQQEPPFALRFWFYEENHGSDGEFSALLYEKCAKLRQCHLHVSGLQVSEPGNRSFSHILPVLEAKVWMEKS